MLIVVEYSTYGGLTKVQVPSFYEIEARFLM